MNLIKKIELNYHVNAIKDLIENKKYDEVRSYLIKLYKKSKTLYLDILKRFYLNFREISNTENLFFKNIIYVNSFINEDIDLISDFLNYYFVEIGFTNTYFSDLSFDLSRIEKSLSKKNILKFDDIIEKSVLYQILLSNENSDLINILKNEFAFFSTSKEFYFSDANIVKCYFLIVDHPYSVFQRLKNINNQDKFLSQNIMFNLDNSIIKKEYENIEIEIIKKGWNTHTLSWTDPNVVNSFKGMIIVKDDLHNKSNEIFSSIVLHLKQSGIEIRLDYDVIDAYSSKFEESKKITNQDISNNEKKFIQKNIQNIELNLDFEL